MEIDIFLHLLYPAAIGMNINLGKRRTGQCPGLFLKERKFIQDRHKLDHRIEPLFLGSKRIQQRIYLKYGGHRETKSFLSFIQHPADRVELVLIDKALEEQVGRELDGDLPYLFGAAFILFPYVFQVFARNQNQIIISYHFGGISHYTPDSGGLFRKVQFKFRMVMNRIGKLRLITFCNIETVFVGQRCNFTDNLIGYRCVHNQ